MNWSPLPYPGGKTRAVRHLMPLIPKGVRRVVSPFCGGCSFEIALAMSGIPVLAFDKLPKLINFWSVLREVPDLLAERVQLVYREFGEDCFDRLRRVSCSFNKYNQAASYYAIKRAQFNRAESGNYVPGHLRFTESSIRLLQKFQWPKLLSVSLKDFRDTLRQWQCLLDFLYLDPPYYLPSNLYGYRGVDWCHEEFAAQLRDHKGRFLLSYNDHPYIRYLYSDYLILDASHLWKYGANKSGTSSEIFILNYELSREQLIESGFDPSRTEYKPADAVSWNKRSRSFASEVSRFVIPTGPNAIILPGDCSETVRLIES
ncbi:MAG: DNA adenine methylase [Desulfomonilaceae bacterium]